MNHPIPSISHSLDSAVADCPPSCVDGDSSLHPSELKCLEPWSILYGTGGTGAVTTEPLQVHCACPISHFPECREYRLVVLCDLATKLYRVSSLSTPRRKEYDHSEEQVETRQNLEEKHDLITTSIASVGFHVSTPSRHSAIAASNILAPAYGFRI
jgi:hypothetical protein